MTSTSASDAAQLAAAVRHLADATRDLAQIAAALAARLELDADDAGDPELAGALQSLSHVAGMAHARADAARALVRRVSWPPPMTTTG